MHFINPVQKLNQAETSNDKIIPGLILNVEIAVEDHKPMKLYYIYIFEGLNLKMYILWTFSSNIVLGVSWDNSKIESSTNKISTLIFFVFLFLLLLFFFPFAVKLLSFLLLVFCGLSKQQFSFETSVKVKVNKSQGGCKNTQVFSPLLSTYGFLRIKKIWNFSANIRSCYCHKLTNSTSEVKIFFT